MKIKVEKLIETIKLLENRIDDLQDMLGTDDIMLFNTPLQNLYNMLLDHYLLAEDSDWAYELMFDYCEGKIELEDVIKNLEKQNV
jgi:hypothetical protein